MTNEDKWLVWFILEDEPERPEEEEEGRKTGKEKEDSVLTPWKQVTQTKLKYFNGEISERKNAILTIKSLLNWLKSKNLQNYFTSIHKYSQICHCTVRWPSGWHH